MLVVLLCVLAFAMLALGFEMLLVMGVPAVLAKAAFHPNMSDLVIPQKIMGGVNVGTLLAIPFFIFAADLMAHGIIARRLTAMVRSLVGHYSGGIGHTTVGSCMAFGAVCGSAPATVAALGRLCFPELLRAGYSEKFSLGLIASSAECALLIPPSITMIIYGWITGTSIAALFAGGLVVGTVLGLAFMALVQWETWRVAAKRGEAPKRGERLRAFREGAWALGLPVVILGGIYSGFFTATEAAAVAVVYAMFVEVVVYRALRLADLVHIAESSAVAVAAIFVLLSMGALLSHFVILADLPQIVLRFVQEIQLNWIGFLMFVNVLMFIAGMFIDPNSILLLFVPTLYPVAAALGIDPVHFGLLVTLNICIGMITPPFGLDLFVAAGTLNRPVEAVIGGVWRFVVVNVAVLMLITYVPSLSTALPKLLL
ncbi:MAG TPA: TRAP transporter large permease [Burkholderiales bacterium]|jgi:C4-dicarboxylate transporter DctM subunit|nr:TRAP transporter large permease [Burkholderiales bacterium]